MGILPFSLMFSINHKTFFGKTGFCFTAVLGVILIFGERLSAQDIYTDNQKQTRILFIVDASGSMKSNWQGSSIFEVAKKLLIHVIDSIERSNLNIEFALRVFGHQYPKYMNDCKDTRLEVSFGKSNSTKIKDVLEGLDPQGWTPIAYSLFQCLGDFSPDPLFRNAIILITDGIENCEGDPCAVSSELAKRRISLKPFIIGLGLVQEEQAKFDCVGYFYDASDEKSFVKTLDVIVSQTLDNTTVQVNLLDEYGLPTETNIAITFHDKYSGEVRYNFVHTLMMDHNPDTLFLNPVGVYDLTVHTIPPVYKRDIELVPGKHNVIAVDAPQGTLHLQMIRSSDNEIAPVIIRKSGSLSTLYVQEMNTKRKYLIGTYDLEILTLPRMKVNEVTIHQSKTTLIDIPKPGRLQLSFQKPGIASIYMKHGQELEKIYEENLNGRLLLFIQPGEYTIVYRSNQAYNTDLTQSQNFRIETNQTKYVRF